MAEPLDLDALVRRYHAMLIGRAQTIVGNREDAEDVVQAVWMKLSASGWRGDCAIGSWLYLMVTCQAISATRSRRRWGRPARHEPLDAAAGVAAAQPSPHDLAVARALARDVRAAFPRLSPEQQRAIIGAVRGTPRAAIARAEGVGSKTVRSRLNRARRKLR